jgi:hypothetical protein
MADYNGWTNYETWAVSLWANNDEGLQDECLEMALMHAFRPGRTASKGNSYALADSLKEMFQNMAPELGASLWADLLGSALDAANWQEIAESFLEMVEDQAEAEEEEEEAEEA